MQRGSFFPDLLSRVKQAVIARSPAIEQQRSGWYAGLVIAPSGLETEPARFTEQLASLQVSLQRENSVSLALLAASKNQYR